MSNTENTQLTPFSGYDVKNIIFSDPLAGSIPDSKPKIEYKRILISTENPDGTIGELIIPTTNRLYSFGVSENTSQETGKVTGYTLPLCLWSRDGPTKKEKEWTEKFNQIVDTCIDHLVDVKDEVDMFELTRSDLTKAKGGLNPLYWKKEKVVDEVSKKVSLQVVPNTGPTLYSKLIYKKNDKFLTQFFDFDDNPLDARDLMGKSCHVNGAIKFESIFIGAKISLQVKLYEAVVELTGTGMKRLLGRPKPQSKVLAMKSGVKNATDVMGGDDDDSESDAGSLETETEKQPEVEQPKKKVVKRVVKKVVK